MPNDLSGRWPRKGEGLAFVPCATTDQRGFLLAKKRIWRLNINLDMFNSISASFFSDEARAFAFQGLALGMNAGACPSNAPEAFRLAFELGKAARDEAEAHQEESAKGGRRSAQVRIQKNGSAQPFRSGIEGGFEDPSEGGIEGGVEPNLKPQATNDGAESLKPKAKHIPRAKHAGVVWDLWQKINDQDFGVRHLAWTPNMAAMENARRSECPKGVDFADVAAYAIEKMTESKWLKENPDRMTIEHFLRPANFARYAANYTPKAQQ